MTEGIVGRIGGQPGCSGVSTPCILTVGPEKKMRVRFDFGQSDPRPRTYPDELAQSSPRTTLPNALRGSAVT
jgi:hypothetical protein